MLCRRTPQFSLVADALATRLFAAAEVGDVSMCKRLLTQGVNLAARRAGGVGAVHVAASRGHVELLKWLSLCGIPLDMATNCGAQPIHLAAINGKLEAVKWLYTREEVSLESRTETGAQAIHFAAQPNFHTAATKEVLMWLRHQGQSADAYTDDGRTVIEMCDPAARPWLETTRQFCTPLHYVVGDEAWVPSVSALPIDDSRPPGLTSVPRVVAAWLLMRGGANLDARSNEQGSPSPLDLACDLIAAPSPPHDQYQAARLVVLAAQPWSPSNHATFPSAERSRAVELLHVGYQLAAQLAGKEARTPLVDVWLAHVMPCAVERCSPARH